MFFCPLQFVPFWTHHLKKFFTDLYELDLDFEQMGRSLTFLEVQVQCDGPNIRWGLKNKVLAGYLTDNPAILRFPDPHTSTARDTVHGLAIALSKKAESIPTLAILNMLAIPLVLMFAKNNEVCHRRIAEAQSRLAPKRAEGYSLLDALHSFGRVVA